jgi:hypothetical protein
MQNMSDNELDDLFKEAADGFTPPQDESAWKQMADRLDQHAVNTASFWNWKTISAVTVTAVISITSVWYVAGDQEKISKTQKKNESNNANQGVVQEQKEQTNPTGKQNLAAAQSLEDKNDDAHTVNQTERNQDKGQILSSNLIASNSKSVRTQSQEKENEKSLVANNNEVAEGGQASNNQIASNTGKVAVIKQSSGKEEDKLQTTSNNQASVNSSKGTIAQSSGNGNDNNGIMSTDGRRDESLEKTGVVAITTESIRQAGIVVNSTEKNNASKSNSSVTRVRTKDEGLVATDSVKPVVMSEEVIVDSAARDSKVADKKDKKAKQAGVVSIKAVVSPDYSSINFFSAGKTGINYGLLAGYSFNNRWSVYTGVISSKKLYDTKDVEGSYSTYNWNGHDYPVKELDGDCRILDIPINVYYTFFPERSFSLRAGLGFSSYIMRKETYVYCIDNYGTDAYYAQQVVGKNNEWFKVMNLSIAVSKKIANRWSAEFEPFVKAPLAGVGEGKVSLVSMGAFINLKFDLTKNK